jgi:hypothetical protein
MGGRRALCYSGVVVVLASLVACSIAYDLTPTRFQNLSANLVDVAVTIAADRLTVRKDDIFELTAYRGYTIHGMNDLDFDVVNLGSADLILDVPGMVLTAARAGERTRTAKPQAMGMDSVNAEPVVVGPREQETVRVCISLDLVDTATLDVTLRAPGTGEEYQLRLTYAVGHSQQ